MADRTDAPSQEKTSRWTSLLLGWGLALVPMALTVWLVLQVHRVQTGSPVVLSTAWSPRLEVDLAFRIDGLGLLFALIISAIGALVSIYAGAYMAGKPQVGRFFVYLYLFMGSMLGLVLADNLILLFVFWELTSISSYLLIGFEHEQSSARAAAWQALLVTALGGQALLAGFILLRFMGGTWSISALLETGPLAGQHALYLPAMLLILAGAATKSAQFPFHFWLPNAMEAPTPVSAYLHSATMVKAGVYLLARLTPVLGETPVWESAVVGLGGVTMLVTAWLAWQESDLKLVLAYSTVTGLAMMIFLIGLGTEVAVKTAVVFLIVHSMYKGGLFLVAGAIDHETGTRDADRLGGLIKSMPLTAAAALLAAASMAGLPPLLGFTMKELFYKATLEMSSGKVPLTAAAVLGMIGLVAAAGVVAVRPVFGRAAEGQPEPHEAPWSMLIGPAVLGAGGLVFGLWPHPIADTIVAPAVLSITGHEPKVELKLWHGVNLELLLSILTVLAGATVYALRRRLLSALKSIEPLYRRGPAAWYDWTMSAMNWVAFMQTRLLQNGRLRRYVLVTLLVVIATVGASATELDWSRLLSAAELRAYEVMLAVLILVAAWRVVHAPSRLSAVIALGVVGFGLALIFAMFGAPDVAMTQLAVETLVVILFVLVLYRLPSPVILSPVRTRLRDGAVALAFGGLMMVLMMGVAAAGPESRVSPYFAEVAVPKAHGRNLVNVILVDFRALDTLGEIVVLCIAALGVHSLASQRAVGKEKS